MTRKDFQLIADTLKYVRPSKMVKPQGYKHRRAHWEVVVYGLADALRSTNTNFDNERFITACGYYEEV